MYRSAWTEGRESAVVSPQAEQKRMASPDLPLSGIRKSPGRLSKVHFAVTVKHVNEMVKDGRK